MRIHITSRRAVSNGLGRRLMPGSTADVPDVRAAELIAAGLAKPLRGRRYTEVGPLNIDEGEDDRGYFVSVAERARILAENAAALAALNEEHELQTAVDGDDNGSAGDL